VRRADRQTRVMLTWVIAIFVAAVLLCCWGL
jgi:hypothetical protein